MSESKYTAPPREKRRRLLKLALKNAGGETTTAALHAQMVEIFGEFSSKTTRRDLIWLAKDDDLAKKVEVDDNPNLVRWLPGRGNLDLSLAPVECLMLSALFMHGDKFGFRTDTKDLERLRNYAQTELWRGGRRDLVAEGRITTGTRFTILQPGVYDESHLATISGALHDGSSLDIDYRPRDAGAVETCRYRVRPLAISYQDSNIYLSALVKAETWPDGHEPLPDAPRGKYSSNGPGKTCVLMLHRMVAVTSHWEEIPEPVGYDVHAVEIQKDLMTIHSDGAIDLELALSDNLHNRLSENRLTEHQVLTKRGEGWTLKCQIADTQGLRLFLLSNAGDIQVLAPLELREHIRGVLLKAVESYGGAV